MAQEGVGAVSMAWALLRTMRPKQWTKNLIIFMPLIFSGEVVDAGAVMATVAAFAVFCALSGAVYIINDLKDVEADRLHHKKRERPIAAGHLPPAFAAVSSVVLVGAALAGAVALGLPFAVVTVAYFALQLGYTFYLKRMVILDVMSIAAGFVLRAIAGAEVIAVVVSPWLLMCAALLALFLGFGKRRHELILFEGQPLDHRPILKEYSEAFIDQMISTVTAATIVAYSLYTFFSETTTADREYLMLTVPFVVYGLFRYLYLIHQKRLGGSPEDILLGDTPLLVDIGLWLAAVGAAVYLR